MKVTWKFNEKVYSVDVPGEKEKAEMEQSLKNGGFEVLSDKPKPVRKEKYQVVQCVYGPLYSFVCEAGDAQLLDEVNTEVTERDGSTVIKKAYVVGHDMKTVPEIWELVKALKRQKLNKAVVVKHSDALKAAQSAAPSKEDIKAVFAEERKELETKAATAEVRAINTLARKFQPIKDSLYTLGTAISSGQNFSDVQMDNIRTCLSDIYDKLQELGLSAADEARYTYYGEEVMPD